MTDPIKSTTTADALLEGLPYLVLVVRRDGVVHAGRRRHVLARPAAVP